jgi:hypothetical protein
VGAPGKTLCEIPEDAEAAHAARLKVREELCAYCPHQGGCLFLRQLSRIEAAMHDRPAGAIVTVHNYFAQGIAQEIDGDLITRVVIDERIDLDMDVRVPLDRLERESIDLNFARDVADAFDANGYLDLSRFSADDLSDRAELESQHVELRLAPELTFDQRRAAIRKHAEQMKQEFRWKFARLFQTMAREIGQERKVSNQIVLIRDESSGNQAEPRDQIHIYGKKTVGEKLAGKPIHYIDGTLDRYHAEALLGEGSRFVILNAERNLRVTQVCDAVFSKNHLLYRQDAGANRHRVYRFVLACGKLHPRILVGVPKKCRDVMEAEWLELVKTVPDAPVVRWMHMMKGRGENAYQDFDACIVIGREEPGVRTVEAMARMRFPEHAITPLPHGVTDPASGPSWPKRYQGYSMKSGQELGVQVSYHPDPYCQSVLEQVREGEIVQIVDRLRGVNRQDAPAVYILSSIPTEIPVDRLMPWRDLLDEVCGDTWFQEAVRIGGGVAPLKASWLVSKGIFETENAAQQAASRLLKGDRSGFTIASYRLPDQPGRDSIALVAPGILNALELLAGHVGTLGRFNGEEVEVVEVEAFDPAAFEPDEPMIQDAAAAGQRIALDTVEGITALRGVLDRMSLLAGPGGLEVWPEDGEEDEPNFNTAGNMSSVFSHHLTLEPST